jgi:hypothetical protein
MISIQRGYAARVLAGLLFAAVSATACNDADTHFTVRQAPDLKQMTVSVLGVFKEGRMSPETWEEIGPKISSVFGKGLCPIAYDTKLVADKPSLAEAVDDYSRENGVTDDLLGELAPAATGDGVLVITVAGHPIKQNRDSNGQMAPPTAPGSQGLQRQPGMRGGAGHGGALAPPTSGRMLIVDPNAYEMSASLYSTHDHKSVALVTMGYAGQSADEALGRFVAKLKTSFPGYPCVGWHMDAPIDDKKIEAMKREGE